MKTLGKFVMVVGFLLYGIILLQYDSPVLVASSNYYREKAPWLPKDDMIRGVLGLLFVNAAAMLVTECTTKKKIFVLGVLVINAVFQGVAMPTMSASLEDEAKFNLARTIALIGSCLLL